MFFLKEKEVNTGRQRELDLVKGFLLIMIIFIHSFQTIGGVVSVFRRGSHEYLGKGIVNYDRPDLQKIMNESTSHTEAINRDNWIGAE